jgi:battenin
VLPQVVNLMLVYVFEYGVQFIAPFAFPSANKFGGSSSFFLRHAFVISQFCYQVGVLLSRSSLSVVRIRRVELLTAAQGVNFVLWVAQAKTLLISSDDEGTQLGLTFLLFAWMVFVGLMGGASYVNVFFNILNADDHRGAAAGADVDDAGTAEHVQLVAAAGEPPAEPDAVNFKELAMNVGALYATLGITIGSFLDVIISNTLL